MPITHSALEYEEEDLFGSDDDSTLPIASSSRLPAVPIRPAMPVVNPLIPSASLTSEKRKAVQNDAEARLAELRARRRGLAKESEGNGKGVPSLKGCCLSGELCFELQVRVRKVSMSADVILLQ